MEARRVRTLKRRLADWINPMDASKVHSLIDKMYQRKNLEIALEWVDYLSYFQ